MRFSKAHFLYYKIAVLFLIVSLYNNKLYAQNKFPVPVGISNQLFYLQRTQNINTIIYELNAENGKLNTEKPINIFWILYTENEKRENLSEMEKNFVYGVKIKPLAKQEFQFTLAAYPKITLQLVKDSTQKYHVYVTPSKHKMSLIKVYIEEKKSSFKLQPTVEYIEFSGIDLISGKEVTERIVP